MIYTCIETDCHPAAKVDIDGRDFVIADRVGISKSELSDVVDSPAPNVAASEKSARVVVSEGDGRRGCATEVDVRCW